MKLKKCLTHISQVEKFEKRPFFCLQSIHVDSDLVRLSLFGHVEKNDDLSNDMITGSFADNSPYGTFSFVKKQCKMQAKCADEEAPV